MERLFEDDFPDIRESYEVIRENIEKAMSLAFRRDEVKIMAVTKTVPPERVNFAVGLGVKLLGENRVQEYL
ncbi:MAG: YggS family pyridoxal phosphate-dependent enzyme, partial [Oscillospiraceae bacterium]|nr:YggS family pyridoxal phosphate-dependent enzyme [Oscillospiraceae bacterium]